ncbi:MAG: transposase [Actinobacteria bacterium]|nr:transposase [Actinomycetota bacterium]
MKHPELGAVPFAAARNVLVQRRVAERFVAAAKAAGPMNGAATARRLLSADLALLTTLERHVGEAEAELARVLPATPFRVLTTTPGWGLVRAARYGAALGDPTRWPTARQVYRAAGLTPSVYESAGKRVDGSTARSAAKVPSSCAARCSSLAWACGCATRPRVPPSPGCVPAASPPALSRARWPTERTASRSRWSATRSPTTPTAGAANRSSQPRWTVTGSAAGGRNRHRVGYGGSPRRLRRLLAWCPASTRVRSSDKLNTLTADAVSHEGSLCV